MRAIGTARDNHTEEPSAGPGELIAAIRRVIVGDLETPLRGDDELAGTWEQMLATLRERDHDLRVAGTRIAQASDARRRRTERHLHDGVQQHLALLGIKVAMLKGLIARDPAGAVELCGELTGDLQNAQRELRTLAQTIFPAILENEGLGAALRAAAARLSIRIDTTEVIDRRFDPVVESAVYFCCNEALENASRHAGEGTKVTVRINLRGPCLEFEVADDGAGFASAGVQPSGLQHVRDRIEALEGTLHVRSELNAGTAVSGTIPVFVQ